jgi:hypothetical protein
MPPDDLVHLPDPSGPPERNAVSDTGNKLVLAFGHSINAEEVILRRVPGRKGNTLNQIGQVMDELIAAERDRIIEVILAREWTTHPSALLGDKVRLEAEIRSELEP